MNNNTTFVVVAIVAALAMFGVVVITVAVTIPSLQQAEAVGCKTNQAFNASKGRCFRG